MSGAILHKKGFFVACRVFEAQGSEVVETDKYNCIIFKIQGPGMMSGPYRGPIRVADGFIIPEAPGSPKPAQFSSASEALKQGIAMSDTNSW